MYVVYTYSGILFLYRGTKKTLMIMEEEWIEPEGTVLCKRTQTCEKTYVSSHMLSPNLKCVLAVIRKSR